MAAQSTDGQSLRQTREVRSLVIGGTQEVVFAGDAVQLAGQIDYPDMGEAQRLCPLLVIMHHAYGGARTDYDDYASLALRAGYAVFRWDKRGTGRSGGGGRGSTMQDAVHAYDIALSQRRVDLAHIVIAALGVGTTMLAEVFEQIRQIQRPAGVLLIANQVAPDAIARFDVPIRILMSRDDWNDPLVYGTEAAQAHAAAHGYPADALIVDNADRLLRLRQANGHERIEATAAQEIETWLNDRVQGS